MKDGEAIQAGRGNGKEIVGRTGWRGREVRIERGRGFEGEKKGRIGECWGMWGEEKKEEEKEGRKWVDGERTCGGK